MLFAALGWGLAGLLAVADAAAPRPAVPLPAARGPIAVTATSEPFGSASVPGAEGSLDLAARGYVEEEYFVSGTASRYRYDPAFAMSADARDIPYVTRILVRRPRAAARFSGVVHLEPAHPVLGREATWSAAHDFFMAQGDAYVLAVVGEDALTRGGPIAPEREALRAQLGSRGAGPLGAIAVLRAFDPERYAPLVWPEDDAARWDALAQIAALIKEGKAAGPFAGLPVRRLYASGWSFNGSLLRTFINEGFHDRARDGSGRPLIDGYLIGISASAFVSGMVPLSTGTAALPVGHVRRTTRPIDVPVIELMTENEALTNTGPHPPENDDGLGRYRLYEVPGLTHGDGLRRSNARETPAQLQLRRKGIPTAAQEDRCPLGKSDVPLDALARAALQNLDAWVERGAPPPKAPRIDFSGPSDDFGNRRGGVPVARLELPLATYAVPDDTAPRTCRHVRSPFLFIRRIPIGPERLAAAYGTPAAYLERYAQRLEELVAARWLRREDAEAELAEMRSLVTRAFRR